MGKFGRVAALLLSVLFIAQAAAAYRANYYLDHQTAMLTPCTGVSTDNVSITTLVNNATQTAILAIPAINSNYTLATFYFYPAFPYPINVTSFMARLYVNQTSYPKQSASYVWVNFTVVSKDGVDIKSWDTHADMQGTVNATAIQFNTSNSAPGNASISQFDTIRMDVMIDVTWNNGASSYNLTFDNSSTASYGESYVDFRYTKCGYSGSDGWTISENTTCTNQTINVAGNLTYTGAVGDYALSLINTTLNFTAAPGDPNSSRAISVATNNYLTLRDIDGKAETTNDASNITIGDFTVHLKFYVSRGVFTMRNSHVSGVGYSSADYTTNGLVIESQWANVTNSTITQSQYGLYLAYANYSNVTLTNVSSVSVTALYVENTTNVGASFNSLRGTTYGAYFRSISDSNITNNNISYAAYGAYVTGNPVSGNLVAYNNLTGNSKNGITLEALNWGGVLLATAPTNVSYNNASYNTEHGIHVNESDGYANVQGNTVLGNSGNGIYLLESASNNVTSNNATGNSQTGYAGIMLSGASTNNTVFGNIAWSNYYGIHLYNGANGNNVSYNNMSYNSQIGAFLNRSEADNLLLGNLATGNTLTGISILSGWNNTLAANNASYNGKNGIVLNNTNHSVISATDARSNTQKAVFASDGSWNNTFTGLTLFGAYSASYYDFYSQGYLTSTAFQNVTFNKSSVGWGACVGPGDTCSSNLSVSWYTNVNVTLSSGTGLNGAAVTVTDAFGAVSHSTTTNSSGWITPVNITEALFAGNDTASSTRNYTPHYFNASNTGYDYDGVHMSVDSDMKTATVILRYCNHPASGDWDVSHTQTTECLNQSITLTDGNLTIPANANLTLQNVTLVFARTTAGTPPASRFEVKSGGNLLITDADSNPATANDETNVSNSSSRIVFLADAGSNVTIRNSEFSGVGYYAAYPFQEAGLWINATWANVTGNKIRYGYGGVYVVGANNTNVSYNTVSGSSGADGIVINEANASFAGWNNVSGKNYGLYVFNSSFGNTLVGNNLSYNALDGIRLSDIGNSLVYANIALGNTRAGITLRTSANGTIFGNNATYNTDDGIALNAANDTNCSYNNASYNSGRGAFVSSGSNNTLALNNTVLGNVGEGMTLYGSNYSRALYNFVSNGGDDGINFTSVLFGNASYNTINNHTSGGTLTRYGLYAYGCDNFSATGNNASYDDRAAYIESSGSAAFLGGTITRFYSLGIGVNASTNATLIGNSVSMFAGTVGGSEYGMYVLNSPNATVYGSNATGAYYGLLVAGSAFSNVSLVNCSYAVFGIMLQDSANSTLTNGTAFGNSKDGIRISNVSYANVSLCTASNNSNNGIYAASSGFLNASYNYAQYDSGASYAGIYVTSSDNATLAYNNLPRNALGLFSTGSGTANVSYNNASYNSRQGIYLRASPHATLLGNNASYNNGTDADSAGMRIAVASTGADLRGNIASGNTQDGIGITDSENFTALLNNATNNTRYGFYASGSANWNFSNNNVSYNGYDGYRSTGSSPSSANVSYNNASFNGMNGFRSDAETNTAYLQNTAVNNTYAGFNVSNSTAYFDANNASNNGDGLLLYDDTATAYDNNTLAGNRGYGAVYVDSNVSINDSLVAANDVGKTLRAWTMTLTVTEKTFDGLSPSTGATVNVTNALFSGGIFDIYNYSSNLANLTTNDGAVMPFILYERKTNSVTEYNPQTLRVIKQDCATYGAYVSPAYKSSLSAIIGCAGGGGGGWVEPTPAPPKEQPKTPVPGAAASPTPSPTASATPTATPLPTPEPEEENVLLCDESAQQLLQTLREILVYENPDGSRWTLVRITLFNKGKEPMKDMQVEETLPANVTLADVQFTDTPPSSTGEGTLVWDVGTLGAGRSVTVTYIIRKQVAAADFKSPTTRSVPKQPATDWTQPLLVILALETLLGAAYYYFVVSRRKKPTAAAPRNRKAT
ncbi:MAG: right-handed parallel beta-helix repeat-containing protein [Candidatus Micrarchaeota archaeon]